MFPYINYNAITQPARQADEFFENNSSILPQPGQ